MNDASCFLVQIIYIMMYPLLIYRSVCAHFTSCCFAWGVIRSVFCLWSLWESTWGYIQHWLSDSFISVSACLSLNAITNLPREQPPPPSPPQPYRGPGAAKRSALCHPWGQDALILCWFLLQSVLYFFKYLLAFLDEGNIQFCVQVWLLNFIAVFMGVKYKTLPTFLL